MINIRRIYEPEKEGEGFKVLIDRLWPRGIAKEKAGWDIWMKDLAPSGELRKWYHQNPSMWEEFRQLYRNELAGKEIELKKLKQLEKTHGTLTLLYSSKLDENNNASALREFLTESVI